MKHLGGISLGLVLSAAALTPLPATAGSFGSVAEIRNSVSAPIVDVRHRRGHGRALAAGALVGAAIIGGAIIANSQRQGYYGDGYYGDGPYYGGPGYAPVQYYGGGYYNGYPAAAPINNQGGESGPSYGVSGYSGYYDGGSRYYGGPGYYPHQRYDRRNRRAPSGNPGASSGK